MALDPSHIMQVGSGFWASKVLLTAVDLEVFTVLSDRAMTGKELETALELHPRATWDFLDALVALGFLDRDGNGPAARYANTPETAAFLDKSSPNYIGGILEMFNTRLYGFWNDLAVALRTGLPQNETKGGGASIFETLYGDPEQLAEFVNAMSGISAANFRALATKFDFGKYQTLCDVGGSSGLLSILVAREHPHLRLQTFDLPAVAPIAQANIDEAGLADRITVVSGDFFADPLPSADVITMGMILHDWGPSKKIDLIRAAHAALPDGGALIAVENIIDDERRTNAFGLLMSLNMLIEFGDAADFTGADFDRWCADVGFARTEVLPLAGPASAAIAYK